MLLAIDTSAGTSVAVVDRDAGILAERSSADTREHAEVIGRFIVECLEESGIAIARLSAVAAGMGPGPFTGLRVGIAAAQAFALGARIPLVRVVSHDAIALAAQTAGADAERLLVVTDARRREVYWSVFAPLDELGLPVRVAGPALTRPGELSDVVPDFARSTQLEASEVSAGSLGMLAELLFANGRDFASAEPLYLRAPDVTVSAGPKRVS